MSSPDATVTVRLSKDLRERLEQLAAEDYRPLSAEIRYLVELAIRARENQTK